MRQRHSQGAAGRFNKASDSDVRLLLDETLVPGGKDSDPEVVLSQLGTSDSDVRLAKTSAAWSTPAATATSN